MNFNRQQTIGHFAFWAVIALTAVLGSVFTIFPFVSHAQTDLEASDEAGETTTQIQTLLQEADAYIEQQELAAAYDLYLRVLGIQVANQHARNNIFEIISTYKTQFDSAQQLDHADQTKLVYQKYRSSVRDFLQFLTSQLKRWIQRYGDLVAAQKAGDDVTLEIVPALETIIQILEDLHRIYQDFPQGEEDAATTQKMVERIGQTITKYKQELLANQEHQENQE